ncbi:hypothetical protein Ptr86124_004544 [Pyrenophora tritici-repentis]|uniref:DUF7924 domain-containing protein n=3 Tax=Pyrenophora tritici-repentis TaxID=45151 RepID=A0A922NJ41_9PLEO|nr:hypothetical protein Ptr86124_004544 [Pyrenophora tritici-repentis]
MPPSPTPSVTSRDSHRRMARLVERRFSSPVKEASSLEYRAMNMADANLFVDHFPEAPNAVEEQLRCIYCERSRTLAKRCAWRSHLASDLLEPLSEPGPEALMFSASEKPWLSELKPTAPSPQDFIPRTLALAQQGVSQRSDPADTNPLTFQAQSTPSILPKTPVFSMPSTTRSDVSSESPNGLTTLKPDITLGLAHISFTRMQRTVLTMLQNVSCVLSEPYQSQIGLRFPFLVVENKGGAVGGNMLGAQNQAAVDGACALNIFGDFQSIVTRIMSQYNRDNSGTDQGEDVSMSTILFSLTTEGPLHEIWVHYRVGDEYHMTCYRAWRTTRREDAIKFAQALAGIVEWGRTNFRENVVNMLSQIEEAVIAGVLASMDA